MTESSDVELQAARTQARIAFDPLWRAKMQRDGCSKSHARKGGYRWLEEQLGIPFKKCHIGYFNLEECKRAVEVCKEHTSEVKES